MHATNSLAHYHLTFEDGAEVPLEAPSPQPDPAPEWARLENCQCRNCPLRAEVTPYCPFALALTGPLRALEGRRSFDMVKVSIDWHGRHLEQVTSLQRVLSSLIGLIGATSGCPRTQLLAPMAHFHQPFSGAGETLFRALGTYFIGQYLRQRHGLSANYDIDGLLAMYRALREVNLGLAERLRSASRAEQSVNGLVLLDVLAAETLENLQSPEEILGELFAPYLET
ncbi:hypothetical protein N5C55_22175 [Pseudomonas otitidis]|uniref:DUF6901 family protein n=1 Tax=Metapseudomonas otitidis TaxID=319939 RepID=UPI002446CB8F|nr:hypothetical protein [Pseudomonas otitidis]MDH1106579.1 hypothetical protein [Pseudomonas otitidis]MDH1160888.1 hypothetical protein [Pseudomonas otitidis]MDH1166918.1 hypothetical protein [Pseudomonas otitidis]